jgi:hypothetical protein
MHNLIMRQPRHAIRIRAIRKKILSSLNRTPRTCIVKWTIRQQKNKRLLVSGDQGERGELDAEGSGIPMNHKKQQCGGDSVRNLGKGV